MYVHTEQRTSNLPGDSFALASCLLSEAQELKTKAGFRVKNLV